ncbi:UNVERIFIED_CONTAM: hypothetical protein HDU68_009281 [Siphonaria sp. JEL0065]|nr:hypothetical protein HDU68_009281 [Siphonaria sp. JEL0065]
MIVHLSNGRSKTVEYGRFDENSEVEPGTIRITEGAQTIHAMMEAHEYETGEGKGYEWTKFHDWMMNRSGYHNTEWTRDHHSVTFIEKCLEHLGRHTIRPEHINKLAENSKIEVQEPTPEVEKIFHAVKKDVILKFHALHKADSVHHTHIVDQVKHLTAYELKEFGVREVEYGTIHIGKIHIGNNHCLHVRVHKYHPGAPKDLEFHSIRMTRDAGIWSHDAPLVYFEE